MENNLKNLIEEHENRGYLIILTNEELRKYNVDHRVEFLSHEGNWKPSQNANTVGALYRVHRRNWEKWCEEQEQQKLPEFLFREIDWESSYYPSIHTFTPSPDIEAILVNCTIGLAYFHKNHEYRLCGYSHHVNPTIFNEALPTQSYDFTHGKFKYAVFQRQ